MRLIFLLVATFITEVCSYKILIYNSKTGYSHSNFFGNIADILVEAGHDVTSFIPCTDPEIADGTTKSKKVYVPQAEEIRKLQSTVSQSKANFYTTSNFDFFNLMSSTEVFFNRFIFQCRAVLDETAILERFQAEKFDVMIAENFDMCGIAYSHLVRPKSLITSTAGTSFAFMFDEFGIPISISHNPSSFMSEMNIHSMYDRIKNIYANFLMHALYYRGRWMIEDLFHERFGADFPSLHDISSHAAYTFTNTEPLIDFAVPTISRVVEIGGIGAKTPKPLDNYWDEILNRRSKNILISFGSVAKSIFLPEEIKQSFLTAICNFPDVTFIWKYEEPEDEFAKNATTRYPNLVLSSWMPQNDLLNDERVTAFITHGGMGSTQETALRGKPGIFVPIFADQPRNAAMMQQNGFGKIIDKFDLHKPEVVIAAIKEVLKNDSYRKNAEKVGEMLAKNPFTARQKLIKTVEFAAEFGPSRALRPQSFDMTFIEYHNLDIVAVSIVLLFLTIFSAVKFVSFLYYACWRRDKEQMKDKKE